MTMTSEIEMWEVGGYVRDSILGVESKDIDFAVEAESFDAMREWMVAHGFVIFLSTPEHFTIRARFPKDDPRGDGGKLTADFVLCRVDGPMSDGRHPDWVRPGTIFDDLARRDFTVNAMARAANGSILDPWGGAGDLGLRRLRAVGSAEARLREDALRGLRAIRFWITKDLRPDAELMQALQSSWLPGLLESVSKERQREELLKCFKHNSVRTMRTLVNFPWICEAIFADGLWLKPTLEG